MEIRFERACANDAMLIIDIRNKSFYDDFIKFGECPGYNISENDMKRAIQNSVMYNIFADEHVVGNVSFHSKGDGYFWMGCLTVIPEYQNKGIGSRIIKYLETEYPDAKIWELETPVQNYRNC